MRSVFPGIVALTVAGILAVVPPAARAQDSYPHLGMHSEETPYGYAELVKRLDEAIAKHKMAVVARASATAGARSIGVDIPGNMVVMVFRPDFAIRMLRASVPAGIEAPLRFYITEGENGKATLTYQRPSAVFAPYGSPYLDAMAQELDEIFAAIAKDAAGG